MKHSFHLAGALAFLPVLSSLAQTNVSPAVSPRDNRDGRVVLSDPQAKANETKPDSALPREIRERLARFERSRQDYERRQQELDRLLRGATTEKERDRIRERIDAHRSAWIERLRNAREEAKNRIPDLKRRLPELGEVLDNARNNARDAVANAGRKRRGQD